MSYIPSADEIKRLQRCINDLVSVLALPALWTGRAPSEMVHTLLDSLLGMLRLDFVCASLTEAIGQTPLNMVQIAPSAALTFSPQGIADFLGSSFG